MRERAIDVIRKARGTIAMALRSSTAFGSGNRPVLPGFLVPEPGCQHDPRQAARRDRGTRAPNCRVETRGLACKPSRRPAGRPSIRAPTPLPLCPPCHRHPRASAGSVPATASTDPHRAAPGHVRLVGESSHGRAADRGSTEALRAFHGDLRHRSAAKNDGEPRWAYLRSSWEELRRFAPAHGMPGRSWHGCRPPTRSWRGSSDRRARRSSRSCRTRGPPAAFWRSPKSASRGRKRPRHLTCAMPAAMPRSQSPWASLCRRVPRMCFRLPTGDRSSLHKSEVTHPRPPVMLAARAGRCTN
jgi:hypothetical protein